jgi:hypothetical protein
MRCKDLRLRMPQVSAKDAGFAGALPVFERSDRMMTQQLNLQFPLLRLGLGNVGVVGGLGATFALKLSQHSPLVFELPRLHTCSSARRRVMAAPPVSVGCRPVQVES